jgi:hypothetical protein
VPPFIFACQAETWLLFSSSNPFYSEKRFNSRKTNYKKSSTGMKKNYQHGRREKDTPKRPVKQAEKNGVVSMAIRYAFQKGGFP